MNAAELFVKCLEAEGVKYIFGLPGEENSSLLLALEQSSIRFILTRHEQAAAFMADAWGRLTGEAGVCLGTLGPGAANLVTGVADGNMDRSPMVVITGQADSRRQHKESHQTVNVVNLFRPITKWTSPIVHPDTIPEVVRKAFKLATTEKPGACHVELAADVARMPAANEPIRPMRLRRPVPDDKIIDQAMELLRAARRPVILAGNGAIRRRASRQLKLFTEATGLTVVSTFMGKGCIPRTAPECLFTIGLQSRDYVACAFESADLVITLGYDVVEYHPRHWNARRDKKIIHIDFLPAEVDDHYRVDAEVVGDLAHALWMLRRRVEAEPIRFEIEQHKKIRQSMLAEIEAYKDDDTEGLIRPQKILWDVRAAMGPSDVLLSDVGAHKMWIGRYYHCDEPNTCLIPNGFSSMGFALPAAIGAKLVHPDRRVLAISGDGGFMMNVQDLETARRIGTKIVVMIWEDNAYGMVAWEQDNEFGRHTDMSFGNPDFVKLAESFGCKGFRVDRSRDLAATLEKAFDADRPSIIAIPIDYRENALLTERLGKIVCPP